MEKILLKHEMKKVIKVLCALGVAGTLLIGGIGFKISSKLTENADYIYSYKRYSTLVHQIYNNFLQVKTNKILASEQYSDEYLANIEKANKIVSDNLAEYNQTEYEEEEEENYVKNITSSYEKYYKLVISELAQYKNGEEVSLNDMNELKECENTLVENVEAIIAYLDYWAEHDMNDVHDKNKTSKIGYSLIILASLAVFSALAAAIVKVFDKETKVINEALRKVSEGNLDVMLECDDKNEFGEMKNSLNKTTKNFEGIIKELKEKTCEIDEKSEGLSIISSELTASMENVHIAIESITTSTEEQANDLSDVNDILNAFSQKIMQFIESIEFLDDNANLINDKTNESSQKMDELYKAFQLVDDLIKTFTQKIAVLSKTVGEISGITKFINDIAEQTNMLALNAAIESARVGEAGKGFAVVADQIRTLAEQSKESANNITELINGISRETREISKDGQAVNDKINDSMVIINASLSSFGEIITAIKDVADKIGALSSASKEINKEKDIIHEKVDKSSQIAAKIVHSSQEVLSSVSEVENASKNVEDTSVNLAVVTTVLEKEIQVFKTK